MKLESELYAPVKQYWEKQGYTVKGEVNHCDMVAMAPGEDVPVIIELKKSFNLQLLFQTLDRLRLTDQVYAAVPYQARKRAASYYSWNDAVRLCRRLGIGLIGVQFFKTKPPAVDVLCRPGDKSDGRKAPAKAGRLVREFDNRSGDYNTGGVNGRKLVTAYRERALKIAELLSLHGVMAPRHIRDALSEPQAAAILQNNYYSWFERVQKGRYTLNEAGHAALAEYRHVLG